LYCDNISQYNQEHKEAMEFNKELTGKKFINYQMSVSSVVHSRLIDTSDLFETISLKTTNSVNKNLPIVDSTKIDINSDPNFLT